MAHLWLASRGLGDDISSAKHTFTSWDGCMSKPYCKWPVIIGIIVGSLIALAILSCIVRCLCCGVECCCACFSCCNCCGSSRRRNEQPYYPPPQPLYPPYGQSPYGQQPYGQPSYGQYQPHPQPVYASGAGASPAIGSRNVAVAQTATFEAPTRSKYNEDALPVMPSWDAAKTYHVEEEMELEKLNPPSTPHERLLAQDDGMRYINPAPASDPHAGDMGVMSGQNNHGYDHHDQAYNYQTATTVGAIPSRGPQHNYNQHRQVPPPVSSTAVSATSPPTYHSSDSYDDYAVPSQHYVDSNGQAHATSYEPPRQNWRQPQTNNFSTPYQAPQQQQSGYSAGYHAFSHDDYQQTQPQQQYQAYGAGSGANTYSNQPQPPSFVGRKPIQGSWREV